MYKAETQVMRISHDEWNRIGKLLGVSGQTAQLKAIGGLERIIWNHEADFSEKVDSDLDSLFCWGQTPEGSEFWETINLAVNGRLDDVIVG